MTATTEFTIGSDASCSDGVCGEVSRVVVDPIARIVTHLVVEPKHGRGSSRLVPLDLLEAAGGEVRLRCTLAEFEQLDAAEETHYLPAADGYAGYGPGQAVGWPYYGLGSGGMYGLGGMEGVPQTLTDDIVPYGEVSIRRGDRVHATDGEIGRVEGLVINPGDHRLTHVLLQEGHLWGRKEVAIPIASVTRADVGIRLDITKQEVHDLPSVEVERPKL
jgi:sporulation protein YlmC with PRC-barrel domain